MVVKERCTHYWILSTGKRVGNQRITHERCKYCGGERDQIETWKDMKFMPKRVYTAIHYPEKKPEKKEDTIVENQGELRSGTDAAPIGAKQEKPKKGGNYREKKEYYDQHKDEILADYRTLGYLATNKKWNMGSSTIYGLMKRWEREENRVKAILKEGTIKPDPIAIDKPDKLPLPAPALSTFEKNRQIEAQATEIIADLKTGISRRDIAAKYGISRKALDGFRRRHGFLGPLPIKVHIISLVDQIFEEETDIKVARIRWKATKSVIKSFNEGA